MLCPWGQGAIAQNLPKVDQIVIYKRQHKMLLLQEGQIVRQYRIALGKNPRGHKMQMGDNRTPEGTYKIDLRNDQSSFYRSLRISYPDGVDSEIARTIGVHPGNWIMIHGLPNGRDAASVGHPNRDWTNGCVAVNNQEMTEIWQMVDIGTPITIRP